MKSRVSAALPETVGLHVATAVRKVGGEERVPEGHRTTDAAALKTLLVDCTALIRVQEPTGSGVIDNRAPFANGFLVAADSAVVAEGLPSGPPPDESFSYMEAEHSSRVRPFPSCCSRLLPPQPAGSGYRSQDRAGK